MTLIAGIFNRMGQPLSDDVCRELAQSVSRHASDHVEVIRDENSCFAKVDIGVFGSKAVIQRDGAVSLMTGEPLLSNSGAGSNRQAELEALHGDLLNNRMTRLQDANGVFTLVHYQSQTASLSLVADKCAVRPMYVWVSDEVVVFASALRILEACALVPKKMDLRGVTEMVALGSTLHGRTPYVDVFRMLPGQLIRITRAAVTSEKYFRWDEIGVANEDEEAQLKKVYELFQAAVDRRQLNDRSTSAFLSGGLDSRLVVASLRQRNLAVHTVNFALSGTQDQFLGDQFAERIDAIHQSLPREAGDNVPDYSSMMADVIGRSNRNCERPRVVWSGEGGSVLLGFVHISRRMIEAMRQGRVESVIDEFLKNEATQVPAKLFRPRVLDNAMDIVRQGLREELTQFHPDDSAWNVFLFLLCNDQSQKLNRHFEDIDLHRLEFQLPFFDSALLQTIRESNFDWFLQHKFYARLLPYFGPAVTSVPWQSYPGHEPCPLPIPGDLAYQWNEAHQAREHAAKRNRIVERASRLLKGTGFPNRILDRKKLRLAAFIHSTGWRDYQYAIEAAETYCRYSEICGGEFSLTLS